MYSPHNDEISKLLIGVHLKPLPYLNIFIGIFIHSWNKILINIMQI